ncbi:hypothetical protein ADUPG1_006433 [Aduncisulcus paluster]|uniref:PCI domain-containing protein n=1 Tax=Aduncisulcus paluster TaxID=2918883 RepID=A0ABQ5KI85_9EUKA|nr:hypothetical protein ADUPG1_006433 [Aduncisulcus paluster]|eukprot:gnl/Carplike_NY0171/3268_a4398_431.p1 GENE.gnl/Carplike_NY0171/3268_a4398_431~~gnl/Carplike_NY0171/3268_a4398_431.p1  ORF type:complete len:324 (-),score=65.23 gnl/Carplike_NY0171/3268_a4398_431:34-1005(-)
MEIEELEKKLKSETAQYKIQLIKVDLAEKYVERKDHEKALAIVTELITELRKQDNKQLSIRVLLLESQIHLALMGISKSKASLLAARGQAQQLYVEPATQMALDRQSGLLAIESGDFDSAFSYLFESFNNLIEVETSDEEMRELLHLLLICKIGAKRNDDIPTLLATKSVAKFCDISVDLLCSLGNAYAQDQLHVFVEHKATADSKKLFEFPSISRVLTNMERELLESHILTAVRPYTRVSVKKIAKIADLEEDFVESKLSELILDGRLPGVIEQESGFLVLQKEEGDDPLYSEVISVIDDFTELVSVLERRVTKNLELKEQE